MKKITKIVKDFFIAYKDNWVLYTFLIIWLGGSTIYFIYDMVTSFIEDEEVRVRITIVAIPLLLYIVNKRTGFVNSITNLFTKNKNADRLLNICLDLIDEYETNNVKATPSCKGDLRESLQQQIEVSKQEIKEWKDYDTDYIKIANTMLHNHSSDLLVSGRYHLYYGVLNPTSCANNLLTIYKKTLEYAVNSHLLTDDDAEEQYKELLHCISIVG